ncbi:MAG: ABC transporter permease [Acidimicrobiia bacterium]
MRRAPAGLVVVSVAVAAAFAAPLGYLVLRTIELGDAALEVLGSDDALGPLTRTLTLATSVSVSCAIIGTLAAWLVTRTDLAFARVWRVLLALPLVIPSFVGAFALIAAFSQGGLIDEFVGLGSPVRIEGFWGAFTVLTLLSYPYVYLPVVARFSGLPPTLEESARALGRSPFEVFRTIVLPQSQGAITAGTLLVFLYAVSDFGAVSLMRYDTLTRRIDATRLFDRTTSITLSLLLGVVALTIVVVERLVSRRRSRLEVSASGRSSLRIRLGSWHAPATLFVATLLGVALLAPVAVLTGWTLRGVTGPSRVGGPSVEVRDLVTPLWNTTVISVIAAVVTVAVVLPVAYLTVRHRSRFGGVANAVVVSGFALPGLVIALAVVFWVLQSSAASFLYQTYPLLVFAYAVHFGAQALRTSQATVAGVPARTEDAARSLGAGRVRRLRTIELPLMRPGLAAAGGLVLLSVMKELPATLLLAPIGFETLATRIWTGTQDGFLARAGSASLVLVVASGCLTWVLTIRRIDRVGT